MEYLLYARDIVMDRHSDGEQAKLGSFPRKAYSFPMSWWLHGVLIFWEELETGNVKKECLGSDREESKLIPLIKKEDYRLCG